MIDDKQYSFLFSIGTKLAYLVDNQYYNGVHYVWCTTKINDISQPPTSNPMTIAKRWLSIIANGDTHAQEVNANSTGILYGAKEKLKQNIITKQQREEINKRVALATYKDFLPVLYIIKIEKVKDRCFEVNTDKKASKASKEYIINDLKDGEFEIFDLGDLASELRYFSEEQVKQNDKNKKKHR